MLAAMKENYDNALENLVTSSQVSEAEATAYKEKLFKDVDTLDKKLEKQRNRQEENLHDRLTLLKTKRLQEKVQITRLIHSRSLRAVGLKGILQAPCMRAIFSFLCKFYNCRS